MWLYAWPEGERKARWIAVRYFFSSILVPELEIFLYRYFFGQSSSKEADFDIKKVPNRENFYYRYFQVFFEILVPGQPETGSSPARSLPEFSLELL